MKWHNLRHALYLKSSDFLAMLSLIHILKLMLVGFGIIRNAQEIHDIQDQAWALITSTLLFTVCLAGSRRGYSTSSHCNTCGSSSPDTCGCADHTSEVGGEKTYSTFHKFFVPIALFVSVVELITMSAYHGIITVLALHLVLISFALTGFGCILLVAINFVGIIIGTGLHLVMVERLYSNLDSVILGHPGIAGPTSIGDIGNTTYTWAHGQNRLTELTTNYGYGLATKSSIVLVDMALLLLQIVGGIVFYSRFWKMGILMAKYKANMAYYVGEFSLLVKLEQVIFSFFGSAAGPMGAGNLCMGGQMSNVYEEEVGGLSKKVVGSAIHSRPIGGTYVDQDSAPNSPNVGNKHTRFGKAAAKSGFDGNNLMDDEREDVEWLKFLEQNESVKTLGKRTYSTEPIQLNYIPATNSGYLDDTGFSVDGYCGEDLASMATLTSLYSTNLGASRIGTSSKIGSRLGTLTSGKLAGKVETVSTNVPLSPTTTIESGDVSVEELLKNNTMVRFNTKQVSNVKVESLLDGSDFNGGQADSVDVNSVEGDPTDPEREIVERNVKVESSSVHSRALNSALKEDKLMNISVDLQNPMAKLTYLILPNWAKKLMKKMVVSEGSMSKKRELISSLRWSGPRSLPHFNALQLFAYEQYEWLYVKWMHSFNRWLYNATLFEVVVIIFYSLTGTILLSYRHYLTLSETDKELYIGRTSRLVSLALRFILYPIISLILIITVVYILLNPKMNIINVASNERAGKNAGSEKAGNVTKTGNKANGGKNRKRHRERILGVYWVMILLCLVDFLGSLFDVFISLGLETPPYAVHNSLVMQFLMTKTAAFLLLRFPTLFILYFVYFVGLFASQFFLKHTETLRFVTMQVSCQLVIGVGSWSFLIRPIDVNRRRVFAEVILPYILYLSNFVK